MNKPNFFVLAALFLLCLTCAAAQTDGENQFEPSYEVMLHVLVASNNTSNQINLPPSLTNVGRKLKSNYSFANYRLATAYFERVGTNGGIEHKGIINQLGQNQENNANYFSEWSLSGLKNAGGQNAIQFQAFRFGARIPVIVSYAKGESGNSNPVVNYEQIGISTSRFNLTENTPTLIGSLSTPKSDEFIFLVLTVKRAEQ